MNETKSLLNQSELNASCSEELKNELQKLFKTNLIINTLKHEGSPLTVDQRALCSVYRHGLLPLGISNIQNLELSYHERLQLNRYLEDKLLEHMQPVIERANQITKNQLDSLGNQAFKEYTEVLELDREKRALVEQLLKIKNRKIHFMNLCAEMRTGPYQRNNVETKNAECKALQIKAETIQKVMIHEVITSTTYAEKAVKEVEANIDAHLNLK